MNIIDTIVGELRTKKYGTEVLDQSAESALTETLEKHAKEIAKFAASYGWSKFVLDLLRQIPLPVRLVTGNALAEFFAHNKAISPWIGHPAAVAIRSLTNASREILEGGSVDQIADALKQHNEADENKQPFAFARNKRTNIHRRSPVCGAPDDEVSHQMTPEEARDAANNSARAMCPGCFGAQATVVIQTKGDIPEPSLADVNTKPQHADALHVLDELQDLHKRDILSEILGARVTWSQSDLGAMLHPDALRFLPKFNKDDLESFRVSVKILRKLHANNETDTDEYKAALEVVKDAQQKLGPYLAITKRIGAAKQKGLSFSVVTNTLRDAVDDNFTDTEREQLRAIKQSVLNQDWGGLAKTGFGSAKTLLWKFTMVTGYLLFISGGLHLLATPVILLSPWALLSAIANVVLVIGTLGIFAARVLIPVYDKLVAALAAIVRGGQVIFLEESFANRMIRDMIGALRATGQVNRDVNVELVPPAPENDTKPLGTFAHPAVVLAIIGSVNVAFQQWVLMFNFGPHVAPSVVFVFSVIAVTAEFARLQSHRFSDEDKKERAAKLQGMLEFAAMLSAGGFFATILAFLLTAGFDATTPGWRLFTFAVISVTLGGIIKFFSPTVASIRRKEALLKATSANGEGSRSGQQNAGWIAAGVFGVVIVGIMLTVIALDIGNAGASAPDVSAPGSTGSKPSYCEDAPHLPKCR